jgi:VWFA-related protein
MRKTISAAIAFLAILLVASYLQAQSGRTRGQSAPATTPANKTETKTADGDDTEGVNNVDGPPEIIEGDVLRVDTSLVTVPVSVMDRYGKYIPNLRRQDFRLFDQGIEQKISYFATVDTPFTVVFVLDTSSSTHFKLEDMHNAAISFVNQLQPQDSVMVVSFDDNIRVLTEPTSDRDALMKAIRHAKTGGSTRLYDAVDMVIRKKLRGISGRKAIVLFTDGVDTTSRSASYSSTIRQAQESDGSIYTVAYDTSRDVLGGGVYPGSGGRGGIMIGIPGWPGGNGGRGGLPGGVGSTGEYKVADEYLHELAEVSGGRYFRGDTLSDVASAFQEVADELRRQYSLGYYPRPAGQTGQLRQIKVRMLKPDLVVRARDSYVYTQKPANAGTTNDAKP